MVNLPVEHWYTFNGDFLREELLIHGIRPVIPPKANRKNPPACDFRAYKDRNRIERMFNRLKQFRRVATRYDKTRKSFSAFLAVAAAKYGRHTLSTGPRAKGPNDWTALLGPVRLKSHI
jgi:transposase